VTTTTKARSAPGAKLRRQVGPVGLMFFSIGSIIGSGWLLGALTAATIAGPAAIISWVLAAAFVIVLALVFAELGSASPVSGGTARYTATVFGPLAGFAAGWMSWVYAVALPPLEAEATLRYLEPKWAGLVNSDDLLTGKGLAIAVVLLLIFAAINVAGVRLMSRANAGAVALKIIVPVVAVVAIMASSFHTGNFTAAGGFMPFGIKGILSALPAGGLVLSYAGFEQAAQLGGESRNPGRDIPRAVITSILIAAVLYILLQICLIGALNPRSLHSWLTPFGSVGPYGPFAQIASGLGLAWLAGILYVDAVLSPSACGLSYVASSSRLSYAMGRERHVPTPLTRLSQRGVPALSIALATGVGILMLLPFGSWQKLVGFITSAVALMYAFGPVSLIGLRKTAPGRQTPYRMPAAAILAPASFVAANLVIYWGGWPTNWRLAVAVAAGFVIFAYTRITTPAAERQPLNYRGAAWVLPWLAGLLLISAFGQYAPIKQVIPFWWDIIIVAVFSLVIFRWAITCTQDPATVRQAAEALTTEADTSLVAAR
jgi:amino acid transporter